MTYQQTLEQKRAEHAWNFSVGCSQEFVNISKGLPALIMNSGLMQVMAFCEHKGGEHKQLTASLRHWLASQFPEVPADFKGFMQAMLQASPSQYQAINTEALAWLKWLRHLAATRVEG